MKKHSSVLMLLCRSTLHWVLALLLAMAAAEILLFQLAFGRLAAGAAAEGAEIAGMEVVFSESRAAWAFGIALILMAALLSAVGRERNGKQGYTLRRLSISEKAVFAWQSVYNGLCFFLLWAVQALVAWGLCLWYAARVGPDIASRQAVFLAFYRSSFLHSLIPLEYTFGWARNSILALGMGLATAFQPYYQRRGKGKRGPGITTLLTYVAAFAILRGDAQIMLNAFALTAISLNSAIVLYMVLRKEEADEA